MLGKEFMSKWRVCSSGGFRKALENVEATDIVTVKWPQGFVGAKPSETRLC